MTAQSARIVCADPVELATAAAELVLDGVLSAEGRPAVCLSGGSSPKRLYKTLAGPGFRERMPWGRIDWFWGDERFVPHDHPDSNYGMARRTMLAHVPVVDAQLHPVPTLGTSPASAADAYERLLRAHYVSRGDRPLFDVTLLGLGEDGHTASLIPGHPATQERLRWVVPVEGARPEPRISLTFPALNASRHAIFLVGGAAKHPVLERLAHGEPLPAACIRPIGMTHWLVDQAADTGNASLD